MDKKGTSEMTHLRERDLRQMDLTKRDLRERDLRQMDLRNKDLRERNLRQMDLRNKDLRERDSRERDLALRARCGNVCKVAWVCQTKSPKFRLRV